MRGFRWRCFVRGPSTSEAVSGPSTIELSGPCTRSRNKAPTKEVTEKEHYCKICNEVVKGNEQALECQICKLWVHSRDRKVGITQEEYRESIKGRPVPNIDIWKCSLCTAAENDEKMELYTFNYIAIFNYIKNYNCCWFQILFTICSLVRVYRLTSNWGLLTIL